MTTKNTGGPAFPRLKNVISERRASDGKPVDRCVGADGMTLRDYFAGQALGSVLMATAQGLNRPEPIFEGERVSSVIAREAYALADAMLEAREK